MNRWQRIRIKMNLFDYGFAFNVIFLTLMALFMILPLVFLISTAFKPLTELFVYPPTFFVKRPTMDNFSALTSSVSSSLVPFVRYAFNSVIVSSSVVFLIVAISSLAAYPLAKHKFLGKNVLFAIVVSALMIAPEVLEIPRYIVISKLGILNTYFALILPQLAFPVGLFLMKQFMEQIPDAIFEASKIDGASEVKMFWSIALPQVKPAWATISILCFIQVWGDTTSSGLFIQSEKLKTLTYYLSTISGTGVGTVGAAAAASMLMVLPPIVIFMLFQKKVVSTMAYSGIKA
jgi:ABC-type glycerol-3-phosphate transport system permease component